MPKPKGRKPRRAAPGVKARPVKSSPAGADTSRKTSLVGFEISELRRLIRLVQRTGIGELEVTAGGKTVRISARAAADPAAAVSQTITGATPTTPAVPSRPDSPAATEELTPVLSPMVGTFYRAPAPDADPYVEVNDTVEIGQTVCIIEAMKLMNEIECEAKGRVVRVLVENGQPVEYGQKLFLIEPSK
jgi:acetyl-CoA carboxylase biotin carboxyl carrier protein